MGRCSREFLKVERGVTRERAVRANDVLGPVQPAEGTQLGATGRALSPMIVPRFRRLVVGAAAALLHAAGSATPARCTLSKHDKTQKAKLEAQRARQYAEAIAWCKENDKCTAYAAERRLNNHGTAFWPDISKERLARRITGEVNNDRPWATVGILTPLEEADLVETCKMLNLHGQGVDSEALGAMVIDTIKLRSELNVGRHYVGQSENAKRLSKAGTPGKDWFTHFFAVNPTIKEKTACREETLRAKWMSKEVSLNHFKYLGQCLERAGITKEDAITDPPRVINSEECPNPWQGTGDRAKIIVGVGAPCVKLVTMVREHSTVDVAIGPPDPVVGSALWRPGHRIMKIE
eukprot:scaffold2091_cov122-Isochrysis_galbana.AAC.4